MLSYRYNVSRSEYLHTHKSMCLYVHSDMCMFMYDCMYVRVSGLVCMICESEKVQCTFVNDRKDMTMKLYY